MLRCLALAMTVAVPCSTAWAAVPEPVGLGTATDFGALAGAAITGTGDVEGDVGSGTGAIAPAITSTGTVRSNAGRSCIEARVGLDRNIMQNPMENIVISRIPPAVLEQRALERWEDEAGAMPVDPTPRPEARRPNAAPRKMRPATARRPGTGGMPLHGGTVNPHGRMIGKKDGGEGSSP